MHACDYVDDNGEEISTSLMPEYIQLQSDIRLRDEEDSVEATQEKMAQMQAEMDAKIAEVDARREAQAQAF